VTTGHTQILTDVFRIWMFTSICKVLEFSVYDSSPDPFVLCTCLYTLRLVSTVALLRSSLVARWSLSLSFHCRGTQTKLCFRI
jgi:hypothetical protein